MTRRQALRWLAAAAAPRPNVVLILADDLGSADLSSTGAADIRTPHIDSLARDGVRLTNCYANPECTPTRAALLTGCYPQRFGGLECAIGLRGVGRYDDAETLAARGDLGLPNQTVSLARVFAAHGYDTAIFGKWHLGYGEKFTPRRHGFAEHFGIVGGGADYYTHREPEPEGLPALVHNGVPVERPGYLTDLFADAALAYLRAPRPRPFFLYLPFNAPHTPIQDPAVPGDPGQQGDRARYARMVERLDARLGDVLREIERWPNTIVLFFSDNGGDANGRNTPWRGRKSSVYEGGIRVPGFLRWTGHLPGGRACAQLTHVIDVLPSLARACNIKIPANLDGLDLWRVWAGDAPERERPLFWRYRRAANTRQALREGRWKFVVENRQPALYDLTADPAESTDVRAAQPALAQRMAGKLTAWEARMRPARLQ